MGPRLTLGTAAPRVLPGLPGSTPSAPAAPSTPSPSTPPRDIEALIRKMTLDDKIGEMAQADRSNLPSRADIRSLFLGSLLSGGGSSPPDRTAPGWAEMYDRYQSLALQTRLQIPLVYGVTPSTATTTSSGPSSSRTTSASAARATASPSSASHAPRPRRSRPPGSTGRSRPASRSRATSAGGERTRASAKRPSSFRRWPRPRCAAPSRDPGLPRRHYLATAGRQAGATRATRRWTTQPCGPSTCRATARRSRPRGLGHASFTAGTARRDERPPLPAYGRAGERIRASRASSSPTGPGSTSCRATTRRTSRPRSTPASTW